jgi:hypothetical protein
MCVPAALLKRVSFEPSKLPNEKRHLAKFSSRAGATAAAIGLGGVYLDRYDEDDGRKL